MSTQPRIRFIVEVVSSTHDANGNRSHFASLTSTKTGKSLTVADLGGPSNMRFLLSRTMGRGFDINYPNVYTTETTVGRRHWSNAAKSHGGIYEHNVTEAMILDLEQPA